MCPLCLATGSVLLASAGSAGGLSVVAAKVLRARISRTPLPSFRRSKVRKVTPSE